MTDRRREILLFTLRFNSPPGPSAPTFVFPRVECFLESDGLDKICERDRSTGISGSTNHRAPRAQGDVRSSVARQVVIPSLQLTLHARATNSHLHRSTASLRCTRCFFNSSHAPSSSCTPVASLFPASLTTEFTTCCAVFPTLRFHDSTISFARCCLLVSFASICFSL
jgi:hypothetical protein